MEFPRIEPELRDDTILLTLIRRGDESAMTALYDRYATVLYSVLLRVLHHKERAEEILRELFLEIWRRPEEFLDVRGSLGAWLAVVARNRAIDELRRRKVGEPIPDISLAAFYDLSNEEERGVLIEKVRIAVSKLPSDQKRIFGMAFFDGLSHREIAEMTGEDASIVKLKVRDTLLELRRAVLA
jgi:RNA polymerase sigma-70 factor (ECF subfamily)